MPRTVNFVESRQKRLSKISKTDSKLRLIGLISLIISFSVFMITVAARLFIDNQLKNINERASRLEEAIISQENIEKEYTVFVHKLESLTSLFTERKDKQEVIEYFNTVFGPKVVVREITYSAENQTVSFSLQAQDVFTLDRVYDTFISDSFAATYPDVEKKGLRRESGGSYVMDISVLLDGVPEELTDSSS